MKRFTITATDKAVYEISIDAETQEEALKEFYENIKWLEPVDYIDFTLEGIKEEGLKNDN